MVNNDQTGSKWISSILWDVQEIPSTVTGKKRSRSVCNGRNGRCTSRVLHAHFTASHPLQRSYVVAELLKGPRHAGGYRSTVQQQQPSEPVVSCRVRAERAPPAHNRIAARTHAPRPRIITGRGFWRIGHRRQVAGVKAARASENARDVWRRLGCRRRINPSHPRCAEAGRRAAHG